MKRLNIFLSIILLCFCGIANVSAEEWSQVGDDGSGEIIYKNNLDQTFVYQGDEKSLTSGVQLKIDYILKLVKDRFDNTREIRFKCEDEVVEALVIPQSYIVEEEDLIKFIPSGLSFFYDENVETDFSVVVNDLLLKVQGAFFSWKELDAKVIDAVHNPELYLQKADPLYIFSQIEAIKENADMIRLSMEQKDAELAEEDKALSEENQALSEENKALSEEVDMLREALIQLSNNGFFGSIKELDPEQIPVVVKLWEDNSSMDKKEFYKLYKSGGGKLSSKEVMIIVGAYFNEF
ncbi:MAG: hypothetical protein PQJ46_00435 [Spirochaetales bacterium]|nr:hypothetical protein [Spirochaetales bacterium]